jgi:tRNA-dependent cyclodipeptide synthase
MHIEQRIIDKSDALTYEFNEFGQAVKRYAAGFIHVSESQKAVFKKSKCVFLVSLEQSYHTGIRLAAGLKYIGSHFGESLVLIADTLQRYTQAIIQHKSPEDLIEYTKEQGSQWIMRNIDILDGVLITTSRVSRWEPYRNHLRFKYYYDMMKRAYESNEYGLKSAFVQDAFRFLARLSATKKSLSSNSIEFCIQYLMEECACTCLLAVEEGVEFLVYPYDMTESFRATFKYIEHKLEKKMCEVLYGVKSRDVPEQIHVIVKQENQSACITNVPIRFAA